MNHMDWFCCLTHRAGWAIAWPVLTAIAQDPEGSGASPTKPGFRKRPLVPHSDPDQLPTLPPPSPFPQPECWVYSSYLGQMAAPGLLGWERHRPPDAGDAHECRGL